MGKEIYKIDNASDNSKAITGERIRVPPIKRKLSNKTLIFPGGDYSSAPSSDVSDSESETENRVSHYKKRRIVAKIMPNHTSNSVTYMGIMQDETVVFSVKNFQLYLYGFQQFASLGEISALLTAILKYFEKASDDSTVSKLFRSSVKEHTSQKLGDSTWRDILNENAFYEFVGEDTTTIDKELLNRANKYFRWSVLLTRDTVISNNSREKGRFPQFANFLIVFIHLIFRARNISLTNPSIGAAFEKYMKAEHGGCLDYVLQLDFDSLGLDKLKFQGAASHSVINLPVHGLHAIDDSASKEYAAMNRAKRIFEERMEVKANFMKGWNELLKISKTIGAKVNEVRELYERYSIVNDEFMNMGRRLDRQTNNDLTIEDLEKQLQSVTDELDSLLSEAQNKTDIDPDMIGLIGQQIRTKQITQTENTGSEVEPSSPSHNLSSTSPHLEPLEQ